MYERMKNEFLIKIKNNLLNLKLNDFQKACREALKKDIPASDIVLKGMSPAMDVIG